MTVALDLLLQAVAAGLIVVRLRGRLLTHAGAVVILAAVVYHGVTELLNLGGASNPYRAEMTTGGQVDAWLNVVSPAILLFTIVYLLALGRDRTPVAGGPSAVLSWRWLALPTAALAALSVEGVGAPSSDPTVVQTNYLSGGLVNQFLLLVTALCAASLIVEWPRFAVVVLGGEALLLAFAGQRLTIVAGVLLTGTVLSFYGVRLGVRRTAGAALIALLLWMAVGAVRANVGREAFDDQHGAAARAAGLLQGITSLTDQTTSGDTYASRTDGNAWPSLVLAGQRQGRETAGTVTIRNGFRLAVPSFLAPGKLDTATSARSEKTYVDGLYGIPATTDALPTLFGSWLSWAGPAALFGIAAAAALGFALIDRWLNGARTSGRLICALGFVSCGLYYEKGIEVYFTTLRGALVLALTAVVVQRVLRYVRRPAQLAPVVPIAYRPRTIPRPAPRPDVRLPAAVPGRWV